MWRSRPAIVSKWRGIRGACDSRARARLSLSTRAIRQYAGTRTHVTVAVALASGAAVAASGVTFLYSGPSESVVEACTLKCEGPRGRFEEAARKVKIADRPSSDSEWSSFVPSWSMISDKVVDVVMPVWANALPGFLDKLSNELSGAPDTLAAQIWSEAKDPRINPEIRLEAIVRVSHELCTEEQAFRRCRRKFTKSALAKYLDLPEDGIHEDDVPTIAMCGSGGGLRAMVAGASSYYSAQRAGLFDCITYTAGVSGSCWLQLLYFSTLSRQKFDRLLGHLKDRLGVHIAFPPDLLGLITSAPTNKFLLSGAYEKYRGLEDADFGSVDVYGLMLGARLLIPKGDMAVDDENLKLSNQRKYVDGGGHPLPIYTAVRHEIPDDDQVDNAPGENVHDKAKKRAWFQWFESTPYELFCEELGAGIPSWSVGRQFYNGRNRPTEDGLSLPELRTPLLLGIWGSAFCATLAHYYKEIRPLVQGLTGFGGFDDMMTESQDELSKMHPITPAQIPNFVLGMGDRLPEACPVSVHKARAIQLMDAGMSNNLPIYPLLRPGRDIDMIIAFDSSADIQKENWLRVADDYARQRGVKGWPIGSGWPELVRETEQSDAPDSSTSRPRRAKMVQAAGGEGNDSTRHGASNRKRDLTTQQVNTAALQGEQVAKSTSTDLGYCNIWVGSKTQGQTPSDSEQPRSRLVTDEDELMEPDAGIAVIYFPFMANPAVEGVDPQESDFLSTWNFVYTPEQVDKVVKLAKTNFDAGEAQVKRAVRAVYERKKRQRLEREEHASYREPWWQFST